MSAAEMSQPATIDFASYRTAELVDRLSELISVPDAIRTTIRITIVFGAGVLLGVNAFLLRIGAEDLTWYSGIVYALITSLVLGVCLGVLGVVRRGLSHTQDILAIVIDLTGKISSDYRRVHSGEATLPPGRILMEQVYDRVVVPSIDKAVGRSFGLLGKPIMWIYRKTLGTAVRVIYRRIPNNDPDLQEYATKTEAVFAHGMKDVSEHSASINEFAEQATAVVNSIGARIRFYVMLPFYLAFGVVTSIACVPLFFLWWFTT